MYLTICGPMLGCGGNTDRSGNFPVADTQPSDTGGFGGGAPSFPDTVSDGKDNDTTDVDNGTGDTEDSGDTPQLADVPEPPPDTRATDPDVQSGCGPAGSACNDNDSCTINDSCDPSGECVGVTISCDDKAPCTQDTCVDGKCQNTPESGFCIIGGTCFSDGQPNPKVACQTCNPTTSQTGWSPDEGATCDDLDACTESDQCTGTGCSGTPKNCDDNNPCTTNGCNQGQCISVPAAGPCDDTDGSPCTEGSCISGLCTPQAVSGSCDDGNVCTIGDFCNLGVCKAGNLIDTDGDGFAPIECGGADCNDANKTVHPSAIENCLDGIDNDCDGFLDKTDETCLPTPCTYHTECYPEKVCGYWPTFGNTRCSKPCGGTADCDLGQVCEHMPGSANVHFCRDSLSPAGQSDAATCSQDSDCTSEKCKATNCMAFCSDEANCAIPGYTCFPTGNLAKAITGMCVPDSWSANAKALGAPCNGTSTACLSGHCDLTSPNSKLCAPLCSTDTDCAIYQECNLVLYADGPNPQTVPFDPKFTTKTHDTILGCYTRQYTAAALPTGSVCTHPNQCRSNKCFALVPGQSTQYCTTFCVDDLDCPATMQCKQDAVSLVSYFLGTFNQNNPNAYSFVRICKLK